MALQPLRLWLDRNIRKAVLGLGLTVVAFSFLFSFALELSGKMKSARETADDFLNRQTKSLQFFDYIRVNEEMASVFSRSPIVYVRLVDSEGDTIGAWTKTVWEKSLSGGAKDFADFSLSWLQDGPALIEKLEHPLVPGTLLIMALPLGRLIAFGVVQALALAIVLSALCWVFLRKVDRSIGLISRDIEDFIEEMGAQQNLDSAEKRMQVSNFLESQKMKTGFRDLMARLSESERARLDFEKSRALSELAVHVAHDIRSPLSALKLALSATSKTTAKDVTAAELMSTAINRIEGIAANLLSSRRGEVQESYSDVLIFDVANSIRKIQTEVAALFAANKLNFKVELTALGPFAMPIESVAFERLATNLLTNAAEASRLNGEILIHLRQIEDFLELEIVDRGVGIDPIILEGLQRGESRTTKAGGNGLGFIAAKRTVEAALGSLSIESRLNFGTKLIIRLPLARNS